MNLDFTNWVKVYNIWLCFDVVGFKSSSYKSQVLSLMVIGTDFFKMSKNCNLCQSSRLTCGIYHCILFNLTFVDWSDVYFQRFKSFLDRSKTNSSLALRKKFF